MKRLVVLLTSIMVSVVFLAACSAAPQASSSSSNQSSSVGVESSAQSSESLPVAASSDFTPAASSDAASSDAASSDRASSDAGSSEPVLAGPSGLAEMNVAMNYVSPEDVLSYVKAKDASKLIVDLRKPADAQKGHIEGAIFAPMNKAVDNNNYADAIANLTSALYDATGSEIAEGKDIVLVCYAGKKYAQAGTDILNALGADMSKVYTMEGGMTGWQEAGNPTVTD